MTDGLDLVTRSEDLISTLNEAVDSYDAAGIELAQADYTYNVAVTQRALEEKAKGIPVTFISQFIKGESDIAELKLKRDIAEAKKNTFKEKIDSTKLQLRVTDSQATREWSVRQSDD